MNCRGRLLDLSTPVVMGILNLTPDSFYDGGTLASESAILDRAGKMLEEGAGILDLGGMSSRPGAPIIGADEEIDRVIGPVRFLRRHFPDALLSIDTVWSEVASQAIEAGADIVNDISGGSVDNRIIEVAARTGSPYILVHMQGLPATMQQQPEYDDVVLDIIDYFSRKVDQLRRAGIKDIILDPGFGFGKTLQHNYQLMAKLDNFKLFRLPLMVGVSRKSMINQLLKTTPAQALNGTTVLHALALQNGANILRVHDVKEAVEAINIVQYYSSIQDDA